jgi:hypothetical protein
MAIIFLPLLFLLNVSVHQSKSGSMKIVFSAGLQLAIIVGLAFPSSVVSSDKSDLVGKSKDDPTIASVDRVVEIVVVIFL